MRKFLMVAAIGALALLVAVPASALDFKFGAEYRVRFYDGVNVGFNKDATTAYSLSQAIGAAPTQVNIAPSGPLATPSTNPRGAQIRLRPRFDVTDDNGNIGATLRLEIGDIEFGNGGGAAGPTNGVVSIPGGARVGNGGGGSLGTDGVNVETKWAYIDFAMPWGVPARVRAGLQPWYLPKGLIVDDDVAGVRAYGKYGMFTYEAAWFRQSGGPISNAATNVNLAALGGVTMVGGLPVISQTSNTVDNNFDWYQVRAGATFSKAFDVGAYYLYGENRTVCTVAGASATVAAAGGAITPPVSCLERVRGNNFVGATVVGDLGFMSYDFDWIWGQQKGGGLGTFGGATTPINVRGWTVDGAVHIPIGPVKANLAFSYATGDKQNGGDSEAFPYIAPSWNGAGGGFEMIGSGGPFDAVEFTQDMPTNLWMIGGWLEYRPVKALWLKFAYGFAGFSNKNGNCASVVVGSVGCYGPSYAGKPATPLAGKASLGQEVSLRADYDIWTNFKVQGQLGWLIPGKGDTAAEYVLQLLYNF